MIIQLHLQCLQGIQSILRKNYRSFPPKNCPKADIMRSCLADGALIPLFAISK